MSHQFLIDKLESDDVDARREAARTLAMYPSRADIMERDERDISDAIGPLAVALFDEDAEVRKHAAQALGAAHRDRQDISPAIPALVQCLSDERVDLRRSASLILRDAVVKSWDATPYESQLGALLEDPIDEVKWGAADALAYHFAAQKRWSEVAGLLNHADPAVAQETAGTLAEFFFKLDYKPVAPELVALLSAESLELRLVAAKAVAYRPRNTSDLAATLLVLFDCLSHKEARIQKTAIQVLDRAIAGFFRQHPQIQKKDQLDPSDWENLAPVTSALPAIEHALSDQESVIQAACIKTLATFLAALPVSEIDRYERFPRLFKKRLRARATDVKKEATKALTLHWVRTEQWDELLALLTRRPKAVKRQALHSLSNDEAIRELGFAPLVPTILDILSGTDSDLRYAARGALEKINATELLTLLESRPVDTETHRDLLKKVREKVHRKLLKELEAKFKDKSIADGITFLTRHLVHEERAVRVWAAGSLRWIAQTQDISVAVPQLVQLLDDPDPITRYEAAQALGGATRHSSIEQAYEPLLRLTKDESARVRDIAFWVFERSADWGGDISTVLVPLFEVLRTDPDEEVRGEVAAIVSTAAAKDCDLRAFMRDLVGALDDTFQRVRFYIARALHYVAEGGGNIQEAVPALVRALEDEQTVAAWASAALVVYATDATRSAALLETISALDSRRKQVGKVVRACKKQLEGK